MGKTYSIYWIGVVLAIVIGIVFASHIENIAVKEGLSSFYYTNMDNDNALPNKGSNPDNLYFFVIFIIIIMLILILNMIRYDVLGMIKFDDSIQNMINILYYSPYITLMAALIFPFVLFQNRDSISGNASNDFSWLTVCLGAFVIIRVLFHTFSKDHFFVKMLSSIITTVMLIPILILTYIFETITGLFSKNGFQKGMIIGTFAIIAMAFYLFDTYHAMDDAFYQYVKSPFLIFLFFLIVITLFTESYEYVILSAIILFIIYGCFFMFRFREIPYHMELGVGLFGVSTILSMMSVFFYPNDYPLDNKIISFSTKMIFCSIGLLLFLTLTLLINANFYYNLAGIITAIIGGLFVLTIMPDGKLYGNFNWKDIIFNKYIGGPVIIAIGFFIFLYNQFGSGDGYLGMLKTDLSKYFGFGIMIFAWIFIFPLFFRENTYILMWIILFLLFFAIMFETVFNNFIFDSSSYNNIIAVIMAGLSALFASHLSFSYTDISNQYKNVILLCLSIFFTLILYGYTTFLMWGWQDDISFYKYIPISFGSLYALLCIFYKTPAFSILFDLIREIIARLSSMKLLYFFLYIIFTVLSIFCSIAFGGQIPHITDLLHMNIHASICIILLFFAISIYFLYLFLKNLINPLVDIEFSKICLAIFYIILFVIIVLLFTFTDIPYNNYIGIGFLIFTFIFGIIHARQFEISIPIQQFNIPIQQINIPYMNTIYELCVMFYSFISECFIAIINFIKLPIESLLSIFGVYLFIMIVIGGTIAGVIALFLIKI